MTPQSRPGTPETVDDRRRDSDSRKPVAATAEKTTQVRQSPQEKKIMAQNRHRSRLTDTWTCPGCDSTWRGQQPCHCTGCHQTLSGKGMFDAHRKGAPPCKTPQEAGATRLVDGIWRGPEWDRQAIAS